MSFVYKIRFVFSWTLNESKMKRSEIAENKRLRKITYSLESGPGLFGYAEWKSEMRSFACSSSTAGSHENSSSVFS